MNVGRFDVLLLMIELSYEATVFVKVCLTKVPSTGNK